MCAAYLLRLIGTGSALVDGCDTILWKLTGGRRFRRGLGIALALACSVALASFARRRHSLLPSARMVSCSSSLPLSTARRVQS